MVLGSQGCKSEIQSSNAFDKSFQMRLRETFPFEAKSKKRKVEIQSSNVSEKKYVSSRPDASKESLKSQKLKGGVGEGGGSNKFIKRN